MNTWQMFREKVPSRSLGVSTLGLWLILAISGSQRQGGQTCLADRYQPNCPSHELVCYMIPKEQAGNNFPEFSQSRTKLWQGLLTLPPRRPKDRSPTRIPAGNLRSGRRRSGKTEWGHPPFSTSVSL